MRATLNMVALLALPLVLAAAGYVAGPALARTNYTVELAHEATAESQHGAAGVSRMSGAVAAPGGAAEDRAKALESSGRAVSELRAAAAAIVEKFRIGGALLGLWCGIVAAVRLSLLRRMPRREVYEIDHGACVACGRCFMSCPRERLRRKKLGEATGG